MAYAWENRAGLRMKMRKRKREGGSGQPNEKGTCTNTSKSSEIALETHTMFKMCITMALFFIGVFAHGVFQTNINKKNKTFFMFLLLFLTVPVFIVLLGNNFVIVVRRIEQHRLYTPQKMKSA